MMYRNILQVCFPNTTLNITSNGLTFAVFWDRAGKPWSGSSGGWTQRSRNWQPQHVGPYEPLWLQRSLRNDTTYLFIPAEPARKCISLPPASLYDALVLSWCTFFLYYCTLQLSNTKPYKGPPGKQHKGILRGIFSPGLQQWDTCAREGVGTFINKAALPVHNGNM